MRLCHKENDYSVYTCNHPVYWHCTLYKKGKKGLCVIQQYFNSENKTTWWGPIKEASLASSIGYSESFCAYFDKRAGYEAPDGSYPTVTVRQVMHALKMKPLKKEPWETRF